MNPGQPESKSPALSYCMDTSASENRGKVYYMVEREVGMVEFQIPGLESKLCDSAQVPYQEHLSFSEH